MIIGLILAINNLAIENNVFGYVGYAQEQVLTLKVGDAERKAILDVLREPVEKELKQEVKFKVDSLKVQKGWAFLRGQPQRADGKAINYKITAYKENIEAGVFDDGISALLHKEGKEWKVITYVIGATDVPWVEWDKEYKAPSGIFK